MARILVVALSAAGCSDPGSVCTYPQYFAGAPATQVENLTRVCAWPARKIVPVLADQRAAWPGAPDRVPTMLDVQVAAARGGVPAERVAAAPLRPRANGLCRQRPNGEAARGVTLGLC